MSLNSTLVAFDSFFDNYICDSHFILFGNVQGFIGVMILSIGWLLMALSRILFLSKVEKTNKTNPLSFIHPDVNMFHSDAQRDLPMVSVIMPCKGVHMESENNWRSQLVSMYGGPLEYIFVTETEYDPAYTEIKKLLEEENFKNIRIKLVHAGLSFHCTQKIHNQLEGVAKASKRAKYILFLDDDLSLHPGTLRSMVDELESDPRVFCATGYSLEIMSAESQSFANYCIMAYRVINLAGFSTSRPSLIWGGCMMYRKEDWQNNKYGIVDAFRDGGYSDDMIMGGICKQEGRTIACPPGGIFPGMLDGRNDFKRYWNYLSRQLYVLDTYCNGYTKFYNWSLLFLNFWGMLFVLLPVQNSPMFVSAFLFRLFRSGGNMRPWEWFTDPDLPCKHNAITSLMTLMAIAFAVFALRSMINSLIRLIHTLSPDEFRTALGRAKFRPQVNYMKLVLAFWVHAICAPILSVMVFAYNRVNWSGTVYEKRHGRVSKVYRKDCNGQWMNVSRLESLEQWLERDACREFPRHPSFETLKLATMPSDDEGWSSADDNSSVDPRQDDRNRAETRSSSTLFRRNVRRPPPAVTWTNHKRTISWEARTSPFLPVNVRRQWEEELRSTSDASNQ